MFLFVLFCFFRWRKLLTTHSAKLQKNVGKMRIFAYFFVSKSIKVSKSIFSYSDKFFFRTFALVNWKRAPLYKRQTLLTACEVLSHVVTWKLVKRLKTKVKGQKTKGKRQRLAITIPSFHLRCESVANPFQIRCKSVSNPIPEWANDWMTK